MVGGKKNHAGTQQKSSIHGKSGGNGHMQHVSHVPAMPKVVCLNHHHQRTVPVHPAIKSSHEINVFKQMFMPAKMPESMPMPQEGKRGVVEGEAVSCRCQASSMCAGDAGCVWGRHSK